MDIYTKVTFSEDMTHVKSDGAATARPELFHRIGAADTQYDIVDNGDTLASGDCKPNDASDTDVYVCRYTVGGSDSGAFTVKVGTNSADEASNGLATAYTHATTLTLDTTAPTVTAGATGYYSDAAATTALTGSVKAGVDIYTKVTFSEDMAREGRRLPAQRRTRVRHPEPRRHAAAGTASRTLRSYTVGGSDNEAFTVKVGRTAWTRRATRWRRPTPTRRR